MHLKLITFSQISLDIYIILDTLAKFTNNNGIHLSGSAVPRGDAYKDSWLGHQ